MNEIFLVALLLFVVYVFFNDDIDDRPLGD